MKVLFQEKQRFSPWVTWGTALLMVLCLVGIWFVEEDGATLELPIKLLLSLLPVAISVLMFALVLKTEITQDYIKINYVPFLTKKWLWSDLQNPEVIDYGFVGGWGIRIWTGYGTVYNTRGSKGLHFKVSQKSKTKEYVVGTQLPEELKQILKDINR